MIEMNSLTSLFGNNVPKTKNGANVAVKNNKMINAPMKVVNAVVENVAVKNNKKNASMNVDHRLPIERKAEA